MKVNYYAAKMLKTIWPKAFDLTTDGCSVSPDGWWSECCAEHDFYYRNDVGVTRDEADVYLYQCMNEKGAPLSAIVYYLFVRKFGREAWTENRNHMKWMEEEDVKW